MRLLFDGRKLLVLILVSVVPALSNTRPVPPHAQASPKIEPKPFAQEAAIVEDVLTSVRFENDGRETVESTARIRIQSESAPRQFWRSSIALVNGPSAKERRLMK
jgi:hypothetical protein